MKILLVLLIHEDHSLAWFRVVLNCMLSKKQNWDIQVKNHIEAVEMTI